MQIALIGNNNRSKNGVFSTEQDGGKAESCKVKKGRKLHGHHILISLNKQIRNLYKNQIVLSSPRGQSV